MPHEHLTPAHVILMPLYMALDDIDFDELLEHAGIPASRVDDLDGAISLDDVLKLIESALALTGDPALGLHLGQEIGIEILDLVGTLVASAPDFRTALQLVTEYSPLVSTLSRIELHEGPEHSRLVIHLNDDVRRLDSPFFEEFCGAAFFCLSRRLVDGSFTIRALSCRRPAPAWSAEYPQVFGDDVEIHCNADEDSVTFDSYLLDLPLKRHSPGLYQQLRLQAARRLASMAPQENVSGSVRRLIDDNMGERLLDLPSIAERMGLTPRTLQRHLKAEGTSFQALYDERRRERARSYLLEQPDGDIETLAAILGYSEPANFYRAFRSWFGVTPREFQRRYEAAAR
ncbi:MAG: hypothetical protein K0S46_1305 [Moraxellaceae bacterium]|jgi:AraC-like DNA-binding protein|nr:hypothetical protein [Moraxellaceae bacterium]